MARYRLRFVLQEVDLPRGITFIGRSLDCHLTLEDPLVSRKHACISVDDAGAQIEDLGSRNGVRVNGTTIHQPTFLCSGDRLRIGTQDLVFSRVDELGHPPHARVTGKLRLCANCRQPYPREVVSCPSCEATEQMDEDALTASGGGAAHHWTVLLFVEALERALRLGRVVDAERLVERAAVQVEELVAQGGQVDAEALSALAMQATATALAGNQATWALWAVEIYGRSRRLPPLPVVERLAEVAVKYPGPVCAAAGGLLRRLLPEVDAASPSDMAAVARLRALANEEIAEDATPQWPLS